MYEERIVSTTGAGDALVSGVLYGALHDYTLLERCSPGIATATRSLLAEMHEGIFT
jgi:sugar/nucleoside kinase (ribokinase family)